jgi:precorrin-6A/cobalt-precorrin-6A reductase
MAHRILILGGTAEARELAGRLASWPDVSVRLSLAGRTRQPAAQPVPSRSGGFGGAVGLARHLQETAIDLLIDATHPYAATISRNALAAAEVAGVPLVALRRPPWHPQQGDRWRSVATVEAALAALRLMPRRVFVTLGRNEVAAFVAAPQHHYVFRSVDPIVPPLAVPHATYLTARGPFAEADERALLMTHGIDVVLAKNSGGTASYGKIAAARALAIDVVLLARPMLPSVPATATSVEEALAEIDRMLAHGRAPRDARGV